jgi:hypothetical protein
MHLSPVEIAKIQTAAAVHDVGKLYTPREILNNPSRLSDTEYEVAKRHAAWGARMLSAVGDDEITGMVRHHHERIDGRGYPDGLRSSDIPLGARIIAVADTFDAITSSRAYRTACTQKKALDVLANAAGTQLDPAVVAAFGGRYSARRSVVGLALLTTAPGRILAALQSASQSVASGVGGVASILPGVGAAGLLALSPGLPQSTLAVGSGQSLHGLSGAPLAVAPAVRGRATHTRTSGPRVSAHHRVHRTIRRTPAAPRLGSSPSANPRSTSRQTGSAPREPAGASPAPPPTSGPPLMPPVTGPAAPPSPPVATPPVVPPVSLPSVPGVTLPPVPVPSLPVPSLPALSVPGTGITPPIAAPHASLPTPG